MSTATAYPAPVLGDLLPGTRIRDAVLVLTGTAFLVLAGQAAIPLWFTPVPLSLATFAVVVNGATLGPSRAGAGVLLYLGAGLVGAPIFADQGSGWAFASFGYVLGYLPATVLVGWLARRRADRSLLATVGMAGLGSLVIYAVGLPWLMQFLDVGLSSGLKLGVYPFLLGDLIKAACAALCLPTAWKVIDHVGARRGDD